MPDVKVDGNMTFSTDTNGIYYEGTYNTTQMIRFLDNTGDQYGNGMVIGGGASSIGNAGGLMIIGAGESPNYIQEGLYNDGYSAGSELLALTSDGDINVYAHAQDGYSSAKRFTFGRDGFGAGIYKANTAGTAEVQVSANSGSGRIYLYSHASTTGNVGIYSINSAGYGYEIITSMQQSRRTLFRGGTQTLPGSYGGASFAHELQSRFNADKAIISRNSLVAFYSSAYSNGALCLGYFLEGYDTGPYGGFFVCHYTNARYVGISNGTYTQYEITKTATSSRKTKENIKPMSIEEAEKLYNLDVISFDYKKEYEEGKKNQFGIIAEDCDKEIPYVVYKPEGNEDSIWGIDYVKFVPYLIKCVQTQKEEICSLKKELEANHA